MAAMSETVKKNTNVFCSFRSINPKVNVITDLKAENGESASDATAKANCLNDYFGSVFTKPLNGGITPHMDTKDRVMMEDIHVEYNGVKKLLENLKEEKAAGPDAIGANIL